jgi:sugar phosphate isomerase/epimerase
VPPSQARELLGEARLRWGGFILPVNCREDDQTFRMQLASLPATAGTARDARCDLCYTYIQAGHNDLEYGANFRRHVERLGTIVSILSDHDIRLALEFVGTKSKREAFKYPFIYRIDQLLELIGSLKLSRSSQVGVLLDSFHWFTSGATAQDITEHLPRRVFYVHVNDGAWGRTAEQQIDNERTLPGETGVIDLRSFIRCLRTIGYDGPVTAEPMLNELTRYPPEVVARRTFESIRTTLSMA